jgi:hypothetical protein
MEPEQLKIQIEATLLSGFTSIVTIEASSCKVAFVAMAEAMDEDYPNDPCVSIQLTILD